MPKRSHVQQLEELDTEEARELEVAELRELVKDGTSESTSESESVSDPPESSILTWFKCAVSCARPAVSLDAMMCFV